MNVRYLSILVAAVLVHHSAGAQERADEWVAKARAYLGPEEALNSIRSLHFEGTIETTESSKDPADASKAIDRPVHLAIDIVFQKPMQQRQILRSEKVERMTVLDGYDAWEKVSVLGSPAAPRITLLGPTEIKRLRAATIENLSFYSNQGSDSRQITLLGHTEVGGVPCVKISFAHGGGIVFVRYFQKSTGRLIKTELENGGQIREEGEIIVDGIRFPRKVINQSADGKMTVISFGKVTAGGIFPPNTFADPAIPIR